MRICLSQSSPPKQNLAVTRSVSKRVGIKRLRCHHTLIEFLLIIQGRVEIPSTLHAIIMFHYWLQNAKSHGITHHPP